MVAAMSAPVPVDEAAPISIAIFKPSQLFVDGDPARGFKGKTTGTSGTTTWAGLIRLLSRAPEGDPGRHPDPNVQKSSRGGWSACRLKGGRRLASAFVETRLLGLDIDKNGDIEKALEAFAPFQKIVHSTYKSTATAPRCRVILLLKETCRDPDLFRRAHRAVRDVVVRGGWFQAEDFDDAGSDPSRLWFLPMVPPGARYEFHVTDGEPLDIGKLFAPKVVTRTVRPKTISKPSAALAWAERKMSDASEGRRHHTVYSMAAWLSEIVPHVGDDDIYATLLPHAPPGREAEFRRAIGDGIRQGRGR